MGEASFDGVEGNGFFKCRSMNFMSAAVEEKVCDGLWALAAAGPRPRLGYFVKSIYHTEAYTTKTAKHEPATGRRQ